MKKSIYITGVLFLIFMSIGAIFKIFHYPGASILLCLAIFGFCFFFWPFALINNYRKKEDRAGVWLYISAFISGFVVMMGALFKIQHWPGANWLLIIGVPLPFVLYLPFYIYHNIKSKSESVTNLIYIMSVLIFIAIFSVFLSISVSREVVDAEWNTAANFVEVNNYYSTKNDILLDQLRKSDTTDLNKINRIHKLTGELCAYIDDISIDITKILEGENFEAIFKDSIISPEELSVRSDYGITREIMGFLDNPGRGDILKTKVIEYRNQMIALAENDEIKELINRLLATDDVKWQGQTYSWAQYNFHFIANFSLLNVLTSIESNVRMTEYELLLSLQNKEMLAGNTVH